MAATASLTVPIAGFRHYVGSSYLAGLSVGAPLQLVRESTNQHDSLAVQVWHEDVMLGFVPRANNVDVAWALDGGIEVSAKFAGLHERDQPVMQIVWPRPDDRLLDG
jgi:hypothetical protein